MKNIQLRRSIAFLIDMFIIGAMVGIFDSLSPVTIRVDNFEASGIRLTLGITLAPVFIPCTLLSLTLCRVGSQRVD